MPMPGQNWLIPTPMREREKIGTHPYHGQEAGATQGGTFYPGIISRARPSSFVSGFEGMMREHLTAARPRFSSPGCHCHPPL